eukprot:2302657-Alexandrium_andersonii.AAC.1
MDWKLHVGVYQLVLTQIEPEGPEAVVKEVRHRASGLVKPLAHGLTIPRSKLDGWEIEKNYSERFAELKHVEPGMRHALWNLFSSEGERFPTSSLPEPR